MLNTCLTEKRHRTQGRKGWLWHILDGCCASWQRNHDNRCWTSWSRGINSQEAKSDECTQLTLFFIPGSQPNGLTQCGSCCPTPVNLIKRIPHRHGERSVSMILKLTKMTVKTDHQNFSPCQPDTQHISNAFSPLSEVPTILLIPHNPEVQTPLRAR